MSCRKTITRLTAVLLISMPLLSACASGRNVVVSGPKLSYPPPVATEALIEAGKNDPESAAWFIDLDRFFQKQELN